MQKFLIAGLILLSHATYAQIGCDHVDSSFFKLLNDYRIDYGKETIKWHEGIHFATIHHATYLLDVDTITHAQHQDFPNFYELQTINNRINYFAPKLAYKKIKWYDRVLIKLFPDKYKLKDGKEIVVKFSGIHGNGILRRFNRKHGFDIGKRINRIMLLALMQIHYTPNKRELLLNKNIEIGAACIRKKHDTYIAVINFK